MTEKVRLRRASDELQFGRDVSISLIIWMARKANVELLFHAIPNIYTLQLTPPLWEEIVNNAGWNHW